MIPFNTLKPQYEKYAEAYLAATKRVLESGRYILGEELDLFEAEFAAYIGCKYCVGLASGLDALSLALRALGVVAGDEVIVPANTYIATVLAISGQGATPVFVEPDEFYCIDASKIEVAISSRTKAIIPVHLYGQPCQMDEILQISKAHGLYVVEDCAQSHGATFDGQMTGTFGHVGCFSFFPTKNLGAFGDAGGIVTNDEAIARTVKMLRNYGSEEKYVNEVAGVNSRLDEIQAALLRVKLKHIHELSQERSDIATFYTSHIDNPDIVLPKCRPNAKHTWHLFVIRTSKREKLRQALEAAGIVTQIHYPIPPHLSEVYRYLGFGPGSYPITEQYANSVLSLPLYNGMSEGDMMKVCDILNRHQGDLNDH